MTNSSNLSNGSNYCLGLAKDHILIYPITHFAVSLMVFAMNLAVVYRYCWKRRNLLNVASNRLLLSLSICDLLNSFAIMLFVLTHIFLNFQCPSTPGEYAYRILVDIYTTFLVKTTVMHLCGVALDRYLMMFYALKYHSIVTKRSIKRFITIAWCIPFLASSIQLSWLHKIFVRDKGDINFGIIGNIQIWYSVASFVTFLAVPMFTLAIAYARILCEIRRLLKCTPGRHAAKILPKQRRAIYIFCSMYVAFVILAMPYFSLRLYFDLQDWIGKRERLNRLTLFLTLVMKNSISVVNPVLYTTAASFSLDAVVGNVRKFSVATFRRLSSYQTHLPKSRKEGRTENHDVIVMLKEISASANDLIHV